MLSAVFFYIAEQACASPWSCWKVLGMRYGEVWGLFINTLALANWQSGLKAILHSSTFHVYRSSPTLSADTVRSSPSICSRM